MTIRRLKSFDKLLKDTLRIVKKKDTKAFSKKIVSVSKGQEILAFIETKIKQEDGKIVLDCEKLEVIFNILAQGLGGLLGIEIPKNFVENIFKEHFLGISLKVLESYKKNGSTAAIIEGIQTVYGNSSIFRIDFPSENTQELTTHEPTEQLNKKVVKKKKKKGNKNSE